MSTREEKALANATIEVAKLAVPGAGLLVGLMSPFLPSNDEAVKQAFIDGLQDEFEALKKDVEALRAELEAQGRTLERLSSLDSVGLTGDVAKLLTQARTAAKRAAVRRAVVRQQDPRVGNPAARRHWLNVVSALEDLEV